MYTIRWLLGRVEENVSETALESVMAELGLYRAGLTIKTRLGTIVGVLVPNPQ